MHEARAFAFRQRAIQAYQKATRPNIPDETRRAWLIVERDWIRMAEREEAKLNDPAARHRQEASLSDQRSSQARASWEELEAAVDAIKLGKDRP
jgi:hypothetical protein